MRFLKENRIQHTRDFKCIRQSGKRVRNRYFIINYTPISQAPARLGIIISKKQIAKAVKRNQVRRQIKEWFRHHKAILPARDYVIIATHSTQYFGQSELRQCLHSLLQKLNSHCKSS